MPNVNKFFFVLSLPLKVLVEIIQLIFAYVCCIFHVVFFVFYFRVVLKSLHYLQQLLLITVRNIFGHTLNRKVFL